MARHVVMFSGGIGSWAAAKRVVQAHGAGDVTLLFTDTLIEDEDLYRFIEDAAVNVGAPLVKIAEGRTPWQVYRDERFLGNSRIDPCSKILKRQICDKWLRDNCDPLDTTVYVGIDWSEEHRFTRLYARKLEAGWTYAAPLCDAPYLTKRDLFAWAKREGLTLPRLYDLGFSHNNCGGFCCKAGQGHFVKLLKTMPERYAAHEAEEESIRVLLGRDVSMMAEQTPTGKTPLTMKTLRERVEAGRQVDLFEIGGCGCFLDEGEATA